MPAMTREELERRAMTSQAMPRIGFGLVKVCDLTAVFFDQDQRRYVEFDPDKHDEARAQTAIKIVIETFKKAGGTYDAERKYIDSGGQQNAWRDITRPSIVKVGLGLSNLEGSWVRYEMKRTGRTWTSNDKETGEPKLNHEETFCFTHHFTSKADCEASYAEHLGYRDPDEESGGDTSNGATSANQRADDEPLRRALVTLWGVAGGDEKKFLKTFNNNKALNSALGGRWTAEEAVALARGESADATAATAANDEEDDIPF